MSELPPNRPTPGQPPPPPTPAIGPARRPIALWIALGVAVALLVGAGVTAAVVLTGDEPATAAEPVLLEPAADPGPDPFVSAVAVTPVPTFPDEVRAVAAATANGLTVDASTGTRVASGTTEALYGGSGDLGTCDPAKLIDFLDTHPDESAAWAGVHDIAPSAIGDYVATLTPVVLLFDTAVTNHGFTGGVAVPRQSVLQAGTAVLVDPTGTPAVRCACGNPLTAPTVRELPAADLQGGRWEGFDPAAAVTVTAGPRTETFTLVDVATGSTYRRPAGLAALSAPALLAATPTGIQRSTDARHWSVVGTVDQGRLASLDASEDLVVAVGGVAWDGTQRQPSGVITTSADGITWSRPVVMPDYLVDVAFGDGVWLALGGPSPGSADSAATTVPLYRSTDGANWDRQQVTLPGDLRVFDLAGSIDFGAGAWFIPAFDNIGDAGIPLMYRSTDGTTWTDVSTVDDGRGIPTASAHNGQNWGLAGVKLHFDNGLDQAARQELLVGGSADGVAWEPVPGTPSNLRLTRLSCTGDRGWLGTAVDTTRTDWIGAIHTSADLITWSSLGGPEGGVDDVIAVGAGTGPDPARCGTPAASAPGPVSPAAGACDLGRALGDGRKEFAVSTGGALTCDEMRSRWTAYWAWTGPKLGTVAFADFGDGWTCGIVPLSATLPGQTDRGWDGRLGDCANFDGRAFAAYPQDRLPAGGSPGGPTEPAPTEPAPTGSATPATGADGDLGLTRPLSTPACDGTGIVILHSSVDPSAYASEMQSFLDRFPDAQYLRTDLTGCTSLNQVSQQGTLIYAAYLPVGAGQTAVCAAQRRYGAAYSKWLDNTSDPNSRISCG